MKAFCLAQRVYAQKWSALIPICFCVNIIFNILIYHVFLMKILVDLIFLDIF